MTTSTGSTSQDDQKLSFWTKMAFGVGDVGPAISSSLTGFFLNFFLLDIAGLRPAAAGTIFLIVKIWDAVNDPLIGSLSDRTFTRWGRRRPWMLFGAVPFALAFFLQWMVPPLNSTGLFWYYLVVALLLDTGFTVVNTPYAALTPELTRDYDERTSLNSFRFSFSILGGVVAAFMHTQIVGQFDSVFTGYQVSAAIWAVIIVAATLTTFFSIQEKYVKPDVEEDHLGVLEGLKIALSNRAFLLVAIIYLSSWLALEFVQANLLLYLRYWIGAEEIFGTLVLMLQVSAFVFVLIWTRVSTRIGKKNVYYAGMSVWIISSLALFFVQPGQVMLVYVIAFFASMGVAVAYLIPWSMLPDVVEMDELVTGKRREGVFYGVFTLLQKVGISLALALSNYMLELSGYINAVPGEALPIQPDSVQLVLRIFVGPAAALVLAVSFIAVYLFPITRKSHNELRDQLEPRQSEE
ncbi:MAG: MFS transporter [Chloroflexi bacterium]|nr:MFS transporter [Chloroflexota bacterium]